MPSTGQILGCREREHAVDRGNDAQFAGPLACTLQRRLLDHPLFAHDLCASAVVDELHAERGLELGHARLQRADLRVERGVDPVHQGLPGLDRRARRHLDAADETRRAGAQDRALGQPDHPLGQRALRHRHQHRQQAQRSRHCCGNAENPDAPLAQRLARLHVLERPHHRHADHHHHGPQRQHDAEEEELGADEQRDRERDEQAVDRRQQAITAEPGALARRVRRRDGVACAQQVALEQIAPVACCTLAQVGQLGQVAENEVRVVAQQRVAVEDQGRDPRHQHDVETHRARDARLHRQPDIERQRGQEQLDGHPGSADQRTMPARVQHAGRRGVDIRHRHQHQQQDSHVVHFTAARARGRGMPEFVQHLDDRKSQRHQQQVVGLQHAIGQVAGQLGPVLRQHDQCRQHDGQPHDGAGPAPQPAPQRHVAVEKASGVDQRNAHRHRVGPRPAALGGVLLAATLEDFQRIGRGVGAQQVAGVQLP